MGMRTFTVPAAALGLAMLSGCSLSDIFDGGRLCTANIQPGIQATVTDSVTGAPAAAGAKLVARDGTYADSSMYPADPQYQQAWLAGAYERAGTYAVTITKPGYRPWAKSGVVVTRGECHVNTVKLEAKLQPAP